MQVKFRHRFVIVLSVILTLNLFVAIKPSGYLMTKVSAATSQSKTVTFVRNSASLTTSAKQALTNWKKPLISAEAVTITAYAPQKGNLVKQRGLATERAKVARTKIRAMGATARVTLKTALLRVSGINTTPADKAVILITKSKVTPTLSPSPTSSPTTSTSPSPDPTPSLPLAGSKFIMNFVDCNSEHKQVTGIAVNYISVSAPQEYPISFNLQDSATGHEPNNLMNCAITWQDVKLSPGDYRVSIEASCIDILDSEISVAAACTPAKYSYFDSVTKTRVPLTGSGPEATESGYRMIIELPSTVTQSGSPVIETDFE